MRKASVVIWVLLLGGLGCAAPAQQAGPAQPAPGGQRPAVLYATSIPDSELDTSAPEANEAVQEEVSQAEPVPTRDPRLDRVAQRLLGTRGEPAAPEVSVVDALMREQGLVEPVPIISVVAGGEIGAVARMLARDAERGMAKGRITHYGMATRAQPNSAAGVLLMSSRWVDLKPVPQQLERGQALSLRGRIKGAHRGPHWVLTPPDGEVQTLPAQGKGKRFDVALPVKARGEYRVELIAEGPNGPTVLANFPVWVDAPPPAVRVGSARADVTAGSADAVQEKLVALIAAERKKRGLHPLKLHDGLASIAQAHSQDMLDHDFVGHDSPRTGGPFDRVRAAAIPAWLVKENVGRGYSAEEIHEGLMQSPGHRANLLSSDAQQLGVGVVRVPEQPKDAFLATELYASLAEPIRVGRARRQLLKQIEEARRKARLTDLKQAPQLMKAAQTAAERFFREDISQKALLDATLRQPLQVPTGSAHIGGTMAVVRSLAQAEDTTLGLEAKARWIGLGVAQGEREGTGPHAIAIVVLYGLP